MAIVNIKNSFGLKLVVRKHDTTEESAFFKTLEKDNNFIKVGYFHLLNLNEDDLHNYVLERNLETKKLLLRHNELCSMPLFRFSFDNPICRFMSFLKIPSLYEEITKKNIKYIHPHTTLLSNKYGFNNSKTDKEYTLTSNSVGMSFFIPTFDIYKDIYAESKENIAKNKKGYSTFYKEGEGYTPDLQGWHKFITTSYLNTDHFFNIPVNAYIPREPFKRHAYITGASGSGKSELIKLLVHNQLNEASTDWSGAIIIDPHEDLAKEISLFKECFNNERVIYFDPFLYENKTPCIDIFNPPDNNDLTIEVMAQNICNAISEIVADSSLSSQMKTLLIPCITVLLKRPNSNMSDLQRFMLNDENSDLVSLGLELPNEGLSDFFKQGFMNKNYDITKKSIYTRLQILLNSSTFRRIINNNATINLEKELDKGSIIIFNLPIGKLGEDVSSAIGRLIIALVKNIGYRRQLRLKDNRRSCYIYIDECHYYIGDSIETTLTGLRKYGIHLILASQVVGQNMTSKLTNIVLSCTAVKFIGYNGEKTLRIMSTETNTPLSELQKLTVGNFYCKLSLPKINTSTFSFITPTHLLNSRNSISIKQWREQNRKGYVLNTILDNATQNNNPNGISTTPDYLDKKNITNNKLPKFKL